MLDLRSLVKDRPIIQLTQIGIYKLTSPSGKIYIGQSKDIKERYLTYQYGKCKGQPRLKHSLNKYGLKNHKFEIVEICAYSDLNIKERYWQDYYDVIRTGLNCILTKTDILPRSYSQDTLKNLKDKYINYLLLKKQCICQYDLEGNFIKEWDNFTQLRLELCDFKPDKLRKCLNNKLPSQYLNSFWKYNYSLTQRFIKEFRIREQKKENLRVLQYSLNGEFIKEWKGQEQIIKTLNIHPGANLKGNNIHASGFIWRYKSNPITQSDIDKISNKEESYVKIYQYSIDGVFLKYWKSKREVKEVINLDVGGAIYNKINTAGFVWSKVPLTKDEVLNKAINKSYLKGKPIIQYDLNGFFIKEWRSASEINKSNKLQLTRYLNKKETVIKNNYIWKYK